MTDTSAQRRNRKQWDGNVHGLQRLGQGGTGIVFAIDHKRVAKIPAGFDMSIRAVERERSVFEILDKGRPSCQYVLRCIELWRPETLVLERCHETVREYVQRHNRAAKARVAMGEEPDTARWEKKDQMEESMKWACQAAQGFSFIHRQGIVHADGKFQFLDQPSSSLEARLMLPVLVGCHNLLLDGNHDVKISDFSGSVILNGPPEWANALVRYDVRSQKPGILEATKETDIFALGSLVYELATGHLPYSELPDSQVAQRFDMEKWPKNLWKIVASHPAIGDTIQGCWEGCFEDADDVAWKIKPDMMRTSRSPVVESDDRDPSPERGMYTGTTFCSDNTEATDISGETYGGGCDQSFSEKRSRSKKRKRRRGRKKQVTLFCYFLSCFGFNHTPPTKQRLKSRTLPGESKQHGKSR